MIVRRKKGESVKIGDATVSIKEFPWKGTVELHIDAPRTLKITRVEPGFELPEEGASTAA